MAELICAWHCNNDRNNSRIQSLIKARGETLMESWSITSGTYGKKGVEELSNTDRCMQLKSQCSAKMISHNFTLQHTSLFVKTSLECLLPLICSSAWSFCVSCYETLFGAVSFVSWPACHSSFNGELLVFSSGSSSVVGRQVVYSVFVSFSLFFSRLIISRQISCRLSKKSVMWHGCMTLYMRMRGLWTIVHAWIGGVVVMHMFGFSVASNNRCS